MALVSVIVIAAVIGWQITHGLHPNVPVSYVLGATIDALILLAAAARAGVRRRFAPHQLRHAHAVEMAREGIPIMVIQRQLGPTSASPRCICAGSITPRSSTPSTSAEHR